MHQSKMDQGNERSENRQEIEMLCLRRNKDQDDAGVATGESDVSEVIDEQETWVLVNKGNGGTTVEQDDWVIVNKDMVGPLINPPPSPVPCGGGS